MFGIKKNKETWEIIAQDKTSMVVNVFPLGLVVKWGYLTLYRSNKGREKARFVTQDDNYIINLDWAKAELNVKLCSNR